MGEWKAASAEENEFGEEGIIEGRHVFTEELGGAFIVASARGW